VYSDKSNVDVVTFNQMQSAYHPVVVNKVFDGYRTFKQNLEQEDVYCHDSVPYGTKLSDTSIILEASFPKTYSRSSFGFGLSEAQFVQR
jgi:hypothetical protein